MICLLLVAGEATQRAESRCAVVIFGDDTWDIEYNGVVQVEADNKKRRSQKKTHTDTTHETHSILREREMKTTEQEKTKEEEIAYAIAMKNKSA